MTIRNYDFEIPANVQPRNPLILETSPLISRLENVQVHFPAGCLGAVGVRIRDSNGQFIPVSGWIIDNSRTVSFSVNRPLEGPPWIVFIEGYNQAIDWPHTVQVTLEGRG